MGKIYFTSDWHLNETRIGDFNPFFRPFKTVQEQNDTIINNMNEIVKHDDTLIHLGDVSMDLDGLKLLNKLNVKNKILIMGNYDTQFKKELSLYFNKIYKVYAKLEIEGVKYYLNHYPIGYDNDYFNIVGHIHGLWKVQPNMINVGVDAWNYKPVSIEEIQFVQNAIEHHYDENVFPYTYDLINKI